MSGICSKMFRPKSVRMLVFRLLTRAFFPIHDFAGTSSLEFVKYAFEGAKYSEEDCLSKGMTYEASLRLTVRLVVFDTRYRE